MSEWSNLSRAEKETLLAELMKLDEQVRYNQGSLWKPYPKQRDFFALGATHGERMLRAGNQQGKSQAGGYEAACHLTGRYPAWWTGRRWNRPVRAWLAGETGLLVRDVSQKQLCGEPGSEEMWGTGFIPRECLIDRNLSRGVPDAIDTIQVRHISGGISRATFKSYEQGRPKFQGEPVDFIWADEECPISIYNEMLARLSATDGMIFVTFTPLKGRTELVMRYDDGNSDRALVTMTFADAAHMTPERIAKNLSRYPKHQHAARMSGIPMMGEGRIFDIDEELVKEPAIRDDYVPLHWKKLWAVDFGIGHPFAAVLGLHDADNDVIHVHHCIRMKDALIRDHVAAMRVQGAAIPVAWPQDGTQREKSSGETVADQYKHIRGAEGLLMLPTHAVWPDGGNSTEAGILEMDDRFRTGRLKVASHLEPWFEEFREYHREDGKIVKVRDDLMSATRILVMAKRFARNGINLGPKTTSGNPRGARIAEGVDSGPRFGMD